MLNMVVLHIKRGDESQFLYETTTKVSLAKLLPELIAVYNGRLRVERLCSEIEQLADHGIMKPPEMQGLAEEQIAELKLTDEASKTHYPSGGSRSNPDPIGKRTGNAPSEKLCEVLRKTVAEAKAIISKEQVASNVKLTESSINEAIERLRGAVMIVYPMGLPPHEEVQYILEDNEDLSGRQAAKQVIPEDDAQLWWAGKELVRSKTLGDFIGKNEKTKIVAKLQKKGGGAPVREPIVDEKTQKEMMAFAHKKQEEWKKLEAAEEEDYLNSAWADPQQLKRQLQGTGGINWKPR